MKRRIKNVAVLGSGVMGSQIACLLASAGYQVLLMDLPSEGEDKSKIARENLDKTLKMKPSPILKKEYAERIEVGNFEDDIPRLKDYDWIIEAIIEDPKIKQDLFAKVSQYIRPDAILSSNTSSIPIKILAEGLPENAKKQFLGTHFFNPPRYLPLFEVIPGPYTNPEIIDFMEDFGNRYIGRISIKCKDTPAFIANRIGIYGIAIVFKLMEELGLSIAEVDQLTGPIVGRPKSATFRTVDLVGVDTLVRVMDFLASALPEEKDLFTPPEWLRKMVATGLLGQKAGKGFYTRKEENGKKVTYMLDLKTLDYVPRKKGSFPSLAMAQNIDDLGERIKFLLNAQDKAGEFLRKFFYNLFSYVSHRIPEIADELYRIDDAMEAGFGWQAGPFRIWDKLGVADIVKKMEEAGVKPAQWVYDMLNNGKETFYQTINDELHYYDLSGEYKPVASAKGLILLNNLPKEKVIWSRKGVTLFDIGDGILSLAIHTKMNAIGEEVLRGVNDAIDLAEKQYEGLVITSIGDNFSAGANLALILQLAVDGEWDELDLAVRMFQKTTTRIRYSQIPVVIAPFGLTLGGGCEMTMYGNKVIADKETYIGLVELGVGLIPAGGGTTEMVRRASKSYYNGDPEFPHLQEWFLPVATARVATSADEAFDIGIFMEGKDEAFFGRRRLVTIAKRRALQMAQEGFVPPQPEKIKVLGKGALATLKLGAYIMWEGHYITEYDKYLAEKLAYVFTGGDLSEPTYVDEQYILDLEREIFLHLLGQRKTLERIEAVLKTGKPLRN